MVSGNSILHMKTVNVEHIWLPMENFCFVFKNMFLKNLSNRIFLRSESWDGISRGEGKQHAWEPVGHSALTDWKKYSGILEFLLPN